MLDLDNFKQVNDTRGHPAGDRVIEEIAGVLRRRMRETDVLARLGGDEFAIVLAALRADGGAHGRRGDRDGDPRAQPADDDGDPITASIGIAMFGARRRRQPRVESLSRGRHGDVRGEGRRPRRGPRLRPRAGGPRGRPEDRRA